MHTRVTLAVAILVALIVGTTFLIYYEVYPGQQVATVVFPNMDVGPSSGSPIIGVAIGFDSQNANQLQISFSTSEKSTFYVMNTAQVSQYISKSGSHPHEMSCDSLDQSTLSLSSYPSSGFLYSSQLSTTHSAYITIQRQTAYCIVVLSVSNTNWLNVTSGEAVGYNALL